MNPRPVLTRLTRDGVAYWTDENLHDRIGVLVAFTERIGGVSGPPYDSLNLAAHVGDAPRAVDENRDRLLGVLGLAHARDRLVTADQVHGDTIALIDSASAGAGSHAERGRPPVPETDALLTGEVDVPLMLLYADCVPVVIVAPQARMVAVVHAGWRGALSRLPGKTAAELARHAGTEPSSLLAYVGPHIGECCYEVSGERLSQFREGFANLAAVCARLDLAAAVSESLADEGIPESRQCRLGLCTEHHVDAFYSYRAEKRTGRHAAIAAVVKTD